MDDEVIVWLSQTVGLEQYYAVLVYNGFDTLDRVSDITTADLEKIWIAKLGHQKDNSSSPSTCSTP